MAKGVREKMKLIEGGGKGTDMKQEGSIQEVSKESVQEIQKENNALNFTVKITVENSELQFPIVEVQGGIITRRIVLEALSKATENYRQIWIDAAFNSEVK